MIFFSTNVYSQELQLLETIEIHTIQSNFVSQTSTDYLLANYRSIGTYWTIDFNQIINKYTNELSDDVLIQIKDINGYYLNYSINSFCDFVNPISPQLIVERSDYRRGDTIIINDDSNKIISQFADELNKNTRNITKKRVKLQLKSINNDE